MQVGARVLTCTLDEKERRPVCICLLINGTVFYWTRIVTECLAKDKNKGEAI